MSANPRKTSSAVMSSAAILASTSCLQYAETLALLNRREACPSAVFSLYPVRIAACFPLKSLTHSWQNAHCLGVRLIGAAATEIIFLRGLSFLGVSMAVVDDVSQDLEESISFEFQEGPQLMFAESEADIVVYGGQAGGGKTFGLATIPLRHIGNKGFRGAIFRRTEPELKGEGGIWEEACEIYPLFNGRMRESEMDCTFPSGARIGFRTLQHEKSIYEHQSKQYCYLAFDEATHFTRKQLLYLFSRNRSKCGVRPYIRMTCNPDPNSFVAELIEWHIDADGYAIPERDGVVRWLVIDDDDVHFYEEKQAALDAYPELGEEDVLSFTFIHAELSDNPALLEKDPSYRGKLLLLPKIERDRLLGGNWKSREGAIIDTSTIGHFHTTSDFYQATYAGKVHNLQFPTFRRFATLDTAGTSKERAREQKGDPPSWSTCAVWDYHRDLDLLFLLEVWRARVDWLGLKSQVPEFLDKWQVRNLSIENAHFGPALQSELAGKFQITMVGPVLPGQKDSSEGAKYERAVASGILQRIEFGKLFVPRESSRWQKDYINELAAWTGLPKETADQIDVSSYGAYETKRLKSAWGGPISANGKSRRPHALSR